MTAAGSSSSRAAAEPSRTMRLTIDTPTEERVLEGVTCVRLEAPDGHRGVQPGHETALAVVVPGVLHVRRQLEGGLSEESFLACEGGLAWIEAREVRVVTSWAGGAKSLERVVQLLRARARRREQLEGSARALLERHEAATRRALLGLQRKVSR